MFPLHVDFHLIMYCHCVRDLKTIEDSQLNIKSFCFVSFVLFFWVVGGGGGAGKICQNFPSKTKLLLCPT